MPHLLAYECPHCHETLQVDEDVLGEEMDCPSCGDPFLIEIPVAHPVDPDRVNGHTPEVHQAGREEDIIETVHPAMFRKHPFTYVGEWALVIGGLILVGLTLAGYVYLNYTLQIATGLLVAVTGAGMLLYWWLTVVYTKLSITNKRTILRRGIVSRFTTEVQHDDIRNIQVDQTMFERLVGVGDIAISSSGQDDLEVDVDGIPQPEKFAKMIRNLQ